MQRPAWRGTLALIGLIAAAGSAEERPRIRELGVSPGILSPGEQNAITDVAGVKVGHRTLIEGDAVRTGVTAIVPHEGNVFQHKVPAGVHVGNGFGKAAGLLQVQELGELETPIILTNTLSVGRAIEGVVQWTLTQPGNENVRSVMIVVATDAPLDSRNLQRLARRAVLGIARTGSYMSNGSGDFVIAFSTCNRIPASSRQPVQSRQVLANDAVSPLFLAVVEAVEEAVYKSLAKATTVTGIDGHTVDAIPIDALRRFLDTQ